MSMMHPRININGMTRKQHVANRVAIMESLQAAMKAMAEIRPHGRDYQTCSNADAYNDDLAIYQERFAFLVKLYNEIQNEAISIQENE